MECSWGSTARGTANPGAATRSCSCPSSRASPSGSLSTCSPRSWMNGATPRAAPSGWPSAGRGSCWLPTTSATPCGPSAAPAAWRTPWCSEDDDHDESRRENVMRLLGGGDLAFGEFLRRLWRKYENNGVADTGAAQSYYFL